MMELPVKFGIIWARLFATSLVAVNFFWYSTSAAAEIQLRNKPPATNICVNLPERLNIDRVWGGTSVRFSAVESDQSIYIGYYDAERWLSVSQINKCTGEVKKIRLNSRFSGWDSHNYISMTLDKWGLVHIAGNMHVNPLIYARMAQPDDLDSLRVLRPTTGVSQSRVTYPRFFSFPDGTLGFSYRDGQSGDGVEFIENFDGTAWHRWLEQPIFASDGPGKHVNAYPTGYVKGGDDFFHVAWVWRINSNVETNFNVNYARTRDFKIWEGVDGKKLDLPITPSDAEVVDGVSENSGLFNNIAIGFDCALYPVISYIKFDKKGFSQIYHAKPDQGRWRVYQSTDWRYRWNPKGGGTILPEISFGGVICQDGMLLERVSYPGVGNNLTLRYEGSSLAIQDVLTDFRWPGDLRIFRKTPPNTRLNRLAVKPLSDNSSAKFAFTWASMPSDTRGLPRVCKPEVADCSYVFDLFLHTLESK